VQWLISHGVKLDVLDESGQKIHLALFYIEKTFFPEEEKLLEKFVILNNGGVDFKDKVFSDTILLSVIKRRFFRLGQWLIGHMAIVDLANLIHKNILLLLAEIENDEDALSFAMTLLKKWLSCSQEDYNGFFVSAMNEENFIFIDYLMIELKVQFSLDILTEFFNKRAFFSKVFVLSRWVKIKILYLYHFI
jgi:hypothetical protein